MLFSSIHNEALFDEKLSALQSALYVNDVGVVRLMLQQLVSGYVSSGEIVDWVHLEQSVEDGVVVG